MKKVWIALMIAACLVCFASCASSEADAVEEVKVPVVLGKDGIPRPDWVKKDVSTQDVHYAVGYGKLSDYQNSAKKAMAEARNVLAEWVSTSVDEVILNYTNDAGEGANRQAIDAFESISKQNASAWLSGSMKQDEWEDAEGGVYVLVSIPVANVADQMISLSEKVNEQVFKENEAAAAANDMMNDAFNKYFGL